MVKWNNELRLRDNPTVFNRSRVYLRFAPWLLKSSNEVGKFNHLCNFAAGIEDQLGLTMIYDCSSNGVAEVIQALKKEDEYLADVIINKDYHAIMVKCPIDIGAFVKGYYSKIYTPHQINVLKKNSSSFINSLAFKVISKNAKNEFIEYMKTTFGEIEETKHLNHNFTEDLLNYEEHDIPPNLNLEII